jgi:polyhydroxybutyrate depolymerase
MRKICLILIGLAIGISNWQCTATLPKEGIPDTGTYKRKLDISVVGQKRNYLLHIPEKYTPNDKIPLVIVLHGAFSTAEQIEEQSGFSNLADREGFLVAYPNGAFGLFGYFQHWNAGHCCGKAQSDNIDDVGFLINVINDIKDRFPIDTTRIYMVGFSNGGMLTYRFAAEHTNILAAAAPMAASIGGRASAKDSIWITQKPNSKLPLLIFHAEDDINVPFSGGTSPKKGGDREYISVEESIGFWVDNNECEEIDEEIYSLNLLHKIWYNKTGMNSIELYLLKEWGHKWPGKYFTNKLPNSNPLYGFDAAEIIWDFFKRHKR